MLIIIIFVIILNMMNQNNPAINIFFVDCNQWFTHRIAQYYIFFCKMFVTQLPQQEEKKHQLCQSDHSFQKDK